MHQFIAECSPSAVMRAYQKFDLLAWRLVLGGEGGGFFEEGNSKSSA